MRCALFGKLPSKRDFVSLGMERPFLDLWESWLQTGVALSRDTMGELWQDAFLAAPIWRFWLGSRIAGTATAGAVMPSVDRIGRYFPLSVCAAAPQGYRLAPPPDAGLDTWHMEVEQFLLRMLDDELDAELPDLLASLPLPAAAVHEIASPPVLSGQLMTARDGELGNLFSSLIAEDHDLLHAGRSYWWTHGGPSHPPRLIVNQGMPAHALFAEMLGANGNASQHQ